MCTAARDPLDIWEELRRYKRLLEQFGVPLEELRHRCFQDPKFAQKVLAFWEAGAVSGDPIPDSKCQAKARSIMGKNFLGLEEVRRGYGIVLNHKRLAEIPYSEKTLWQRKDTHVLVAGSQLSVNEVRKLADGDFKDTDWYSLKAFANDKKVSLRWHLLRSAPVPKSHSKTYDQQTALLKGEEVPFACEMTYMVILYWLTHRKRLLPDAYVRCRDKVSVSDINRVIVGRFSDEFYVNGYWDGGHLPRLGLASSVPPRRS